MGLTLVDTSAWVEFLRGTGSAVNHRVRSMIESEAPLATTDVVIMELLCGIGDPAGRGRIWAFVNRLTMLPTRPLFDFEVAADLYSRCRGSGFTPANTNDLLVAAVAIGKEVPLLAFDRDFERVAAVSNLELAPV